MGPVIQENVTKILVVVGCSRAVDENASKDAVPSLHSEVRVVPRASVLRRSPFVGLSVSRGEGALCNGRDAVHLLKAGVSTEGFWKEQDE